jgi:CheY-like chemotaxis protein
MIMNELKYAIVCVDDDPFILQMLGFQLEKLIERQSTVIEFFTDPVEAIRNINQLVAEKIEILFVIVDYQMQNMTGAEFIRALKDQFPEIRCIMLSGQASAIHVDDLVNDNLLDSFISKPWDEKELYSRTQEILKKKYQVK